MNKNSKDILSVSLIAIIIVLLPTLLNDYFVEKKGLASDF